MLYLLFHLGPDRYAIAASQVLEVLPVVNVKQIPQAPRGVAGLFNYHDSPVPLIDLSDMALGRPARRWMSTRIILVDYPAGSGSQPLGLLAERTTETRNWAPDQFKDAGASSEGHGYLGPVATDGSGLVQRIEIKHLLTESLRIQLFRESSNSA